MKRGFDDEYALDLESLDRVLVNVITSDKDKVISWVREEPGSWGFYRLMVLSVCRVLQIEVMLSYILRGKLH